MSFDLQYVQYQDVLPVSAVQRISGVSPPVYEIQGRDFRSASSVLLNDIPARAVAIRTRTTLLAQMNASFAVDRLRQVTVLSTNLTMTDQSLLRFSFSQAARPVGGIAKLVQTFVKLLFTTPGSDIYDRPAGGNVTSIRSLSASEENRGLLTGALDSAVARTASQLTTAQPNQRNLPLAERLLSAKLVSASFDPNSGTLYGRVRLISQAGAEALVNVVQEAA